MLLEWHRLAPIGVYNNSYPWPALKTLLTDDPAVAAALLRRGELVAFPTETVYGLGADAFSAKAVAAIFDAKERPVDNPLIVHIVHQRQIPDIASSLSREAQTLIDHFFPGPLTVVLRKHASLPPVVTAALDTVAVRMPSHALARRFLSACASPVAAPSANRSGRPSATTWQAVRDDLEGRISAILRGAPSPVGIESTVVDCSTSGPPQLLRAGAISIEQLLAVVPSLYVAQIASESAVRSPGMRHRHYAPKIHLELVKTPHEAVPHPKHAYIGIAPVDEPGAFGRFLHAQDAQGYARALFDFFRQCELIGIHTIYCQMTTEAGIGRALADRLRRAAAA